VIDDVESSFLEAGKITHVTLLGLNFNVIMRCGFLISPQLIFGEIKNSRPGAE
jgi:hypothetical protein